MKKSFLVLACFASSVAFAQPSLTVQGAPMNLEGKSLHAVAALMAHADRLDDVLRYGRTVTFVAVQQGIEGARYQFGFGSCTVDPAYICTTRAVLVVDRGSTGGAHHFYDNARIETVRPGFRPGGALDDATPQVVQAIAGVYRDSMQAARHGRVVGVAAQFVRPGLARFRINLRACASLDGGPARCFSGAYFLIEARTRRDGVVSRTTYTTRLAVMQ